MAKGWDEHTYLGVGLIGCGAIGTIIAKAIDKGRVGEVELLTVYDIIREHAEELAEKLLKKPIISTSSDELIERTDIQLVIEAASQEAVRQYALKVLEEGKDFMVMSTGALVDDDFLKQVLGVAKERERKIYIPSGAIVGLDNVKSAAMGEIYEATLTTRKPPPSFEGAPFIEERKIDLLTVKQPMLLYEGTAREAVNLFPSNINVAASLSLAGVGADKTRVKIIADPTIKNIIHEVHVRGEFGEFETRTINKPFPENPKTSFIAALSAIATLKKIAGNIIVGT